MNLPIIEALSGVLAAVAAYFSIKAKKEAGEANNAVNHTDKDKPRLYDLALSNYEGVARIKERQKSIEKTVDKLEQNQGLMVGKLNDHDKTLKEHSTILSKITKGE